MNAVNPTSSQLMRAAEGRVGIAGYARMLAGLRQGPQTVKELAERFGFSKTGLAVILRHCLRAGIVHRASWVRPTPKSPFVPRWAIGSDGDVQPIGYTKNTTTSTCRVPSSLILMTTILQMTQESACTIAQLTQALCMDESSVRRALRVLRDNKLIHISGWDRVYEAGPGRAEYAACLAQPLADEPRAGRMPNTEKWRRQRQKMQQRAVLHALAGVAANTERAAA